MGKIGEGLPSGDYFYPPATSDLETGHQGRSSGSLAPACGIEKGSRASKGSSLRSEDDGKASTFSGPPPPFAPGLPVTEEVDGSMTPVEGSSPLGTEVGFLSAFLLNISQMIGVLFWALIGQAVHAANTALQGLASMRCPASCWSRSGAWACV